MSKDIQHRSKSRPITIVTDRGVLLQKRTLRLHRVLRSARRDTKAMFAEKEAAAHAAFLNRVELDWTPMDLVLAQNK